jgi:pyridoxine 5-phosphate synthase
MFWTPDRKHVFEAYRRAALTAQKVGLGLNAGHDLNLENLPYLVQHLPGLLEVSIGHALICDALDMGLRQAVKAYLKALGYNTGQES